MFVRVVFHLFQWQWSLLIFSCVVFKFSNKCQSILVRQRWARSLKTNNSYTFFAHITWHECYGIFSYGIFSYGLLFHLHRGRVIRNWCSTTLHNQHVNLFRVFCLSRRLFFLYGNDFHFAGGARLGKGFHLVEHGYNFYLVRLGYGFHLVRLGYGFYFAGYSSVILNCGFSYFNGVHFRLYSKRNEYKINAVIQRFILSSRMTHPSKKTTTMKKHINDIRY